MPARCARAMGRSFSGGGKPNTLKWAIWMSAKPAAAIASTQALFYLGEAIPQTGADERIIGILDRPKISGEVADPTPQYAGFRNIFSCMMPFTATDKLTSYVGEPTCEWFILAARNQDIGAIRLRLPSLPA